jgi:hypothetical protein
MIHSAKREQYWSFWFNYQDQEVIDEIGLYRLLRPVRLQRPIRSMRLQSFKSLKNHH